MQFGLEHQRPLPINLSDYPAHLTEPRATFVTLHLHDQLRGCIGHLDAERPLVTDIAENAFAAAFRDPRFPPVSVSEASQLAYHISVLERPVPLNVQSEQELIDVLNPGQDGVILENGKRRGTFLPSVWTSLPRPADFVSQLKLKAGLPARGWSRSYQVWRYRVEEF